MTRTPPCRPPRIPAGAERRPIPRSAFTLAEALVALALAGMAGSSLLLASYTSLFQLADSNDRMLAAGIARDIMDEILGWPYCEKGVSPYQWPLGPGPGEVARKDYDDMDDYNGYTVTAPLKDRFDIQLGQGNRAGGLRDPAFRASTVFVSNWIATITVTYVSSANWEVALPAGSTSDFRAVEVVVSRLEQGQTRELARLRRIVGYVPSS